MSIESIKLLRDTANQILKDYCKKENENFWEVRTFVIREIDEANMKLPIDFYVAYYNYCLANFKITEDENNR